MAETLGVLEAAGRERKAARQELARREQAAKDAADAPIRRAIERAQRNAGKWVALRALELVARFQHPELADETLVAARLTEDEGRELLKLAARRLEGEQPLTDEELHRYETLVAKTTDDPDIFERETNRAEPSRRSATRSKPPSGVTRRPTTCSPPMVGDPEALLDALRYMLRPGAVEVDEFGREIHGKHDARLLELEDVGVLFVLVASIVSNGGRPDRRAGERSARRRSSAAAKAGARGAPQSRVHRQLGGRQRHPCQPRPNAAAKSPAKWGIELPSVPDDASA